MGKALLSAGIAGASTVWAVIAGQNHDTTPEVSAPVTEESQPMLDRDNDGLSDYIDRDGGEGWANVVEKEQEAPIQNQEIQKEPETPKVQQEPVVKQEQVVQNTPEPEKASEMQEALKQPIERPSLSSMVQQEEHRMVIDPHSHRIVEFSLDKQGTVHTHNTEHISGSNELHDSIVNNVVNAARDRGVLTTDETAFVEKHISQEVGSEIINKYSLDTAATETKTSVTAALSTQEKMAALRGGISVTEAQEAKLTPHTPSAEKNVSTNTAQMGAWKRNTTLDY